MTVERDPATGCVTVDGHLWTDRQVRQALDDARACMESRGRPDPARKSGIRPAAPCDCACCSIYRLRQYGRRSFVGHLFDAGEAP